MRVSIGDIRLYFDVEGAGLVPDGLVMREKPTLILLHGGPGVDHSIYKPDWGVFADIAQVIYLDHRGNGRSDQSAPDKWNLAQWGDDLRAFCEALEIEKPIVAGTSFGGFVAQAYATRHPDHPSKLILTSTAARFDFEAMFAAFERLGGPEARAAAEGYWLTPTSESRAHYGATCLKHYFTRFDPTEWAARMQLKDDVAIHFNGAPNEMGRMDFRAGLGDVSCPVLVQAGAEDPVTPPAFTDVIAASLPQDLVSYRVYEDAGHGVVQDRPDAMEEIRRFILS